LHNNIQESEFRIQESGVSRGLGVSSARRARETREKEKWKYSMRLRAEFALQISRVSRVNKVEFFTHLRATRSFILQLLTPEF